MPSTTFCPRGLFCGRLGLISMAVFSIRRRVIVLAARSAPLALDQLFDGGPHPPCGTSRCETAAPQGSTLIRLIVWKKDRCLQFGPRHQLRSGASGAWPYGLPHRTQATSLQFTDCGRYWHSPLMSSRTVSFPGGAFQILPALHWRSRPRRVRLASNGIMGSQRVEGRDHPDTSVRSIYQVAPPPAWL